jgi:hypothetical protein
LVRLGRRPSKSTLRSAPVPVAGPESTRTLPQSIPALCLTDLRPTAHVGVTLLIAS